MKLLNKILILLGIIFPIFGCSNFVNLTELGFLTYPSSRFQIVSRNDSFFISFDQEIKKHNVENFLTVTSGSEKISGDFNWNGNSLIFKPKEPLIPGRTYYFDFSGNIISYDFREFDISCSIPFYVESTPKILIIEESRPASGAVVNTEEEINIEFSEPMDSEIFEKEFKISPYVKWEASWNSEFTEVTISPEERWINKSLYTWTLPSAIVAQSGIAFLEEQKGYFLTQEDVDPPSTPLITTVTFSPSLQQYITNIQPELLDNESSISFHFDEEVNFSSLKSALRIDPAIQGELIKFTAQEYIYRITDNLIPEQIYTITLKEGIEDIDGNETTTDYEVALTCSIPAQDITVHDSEMNSDIPQSYVNSDNPWIISVEDPAGLRHHNFEILFSEPYVSTEERALILSNIAISSIFPNSSNPALTTYSWLNSNTLLLRYEGFINSTSSSKQYYSFEIKNGETKSANSSGSYIVDPFKIILETEE